jgi:SAM-dependent methyltransferase
MQQAQFDLHAQIEKRHWWFIARRRILRSLIEAVVPPNENRLVIDVGCGTGGNVAALAGAYQCLGVDTSSDGIRLAQARFPDVRFVCGKAPEALGEAAGQADLFLLTDVLEHVPDDFWMLSELLAAAKPGAQVLITVPADMALWSPHDEAFGHYRRYDAERLAAVWDGLPVRQRLLSYFNARLYPAVRWVRDRNRKRGQAAGDAGTDFDLPSPPVNWLLRRIFEGEQSRLLRSLRRGARGYGRGVSLVAILQRLPGEIEPRRVPAALAAMDRPVRGTPAGEIDHATESATRETNEVACEAELASGSLR